MKRRAAGPAKRRGAPANKKRREVAIDWDAALDSDELPSEEEEVDGRGAAGKARARAGTESSDEEMRETADEKRARLAKEYLGKLATLQAGADDEEDVVAQQLQQDALEAAGKTTRAVARSLPSAIVAGSVLRGHQRAPTCLALSEDERWIFTGGKDCSIIHWDVETGKRLAVMKGRKVPAHEVDETTVTTHTDEVLAVAASTDGRYLVSGGRDRLLRVWDTRTHTVAEKFKGHTGAITCLAFQHNTRTLFSGSEDRTVRVWNLNEMAYVETLFGHQSEVNGLDSLVRERAVSVGRDKSLRVWKLPEQSQLLFRGGDGSLDCVRMVNEQYSVSGGDDGALRLWHLGKRKPLHSVLEAHGSADHWVSAVAALRGTDLVASGSRDGLLRLWQCDIPARKLLPVGTVPLAGVINGLAFGRSGRFLVAAVGQEHRLGRWWTEPSAKNGPCIVPLELDM